MRKPIVKVFTGQRRVGKSYMLFQLMIKILKEDPGAHIIYVNKEDTQYDFITSYADLVKYVKSKLVSGQMNYIFIDEIQDIADFEKAVRSLLLDKNNDIYITGSNARLFSAQLSPLNS